MKTVALRQALDEGGYDAAIGGARRDEERSRAKERVFSLREPGHRWEPRKQRPEFWRTANTQLSEGQTMRVFPLSNWTELDVWRYIQRENIDGRAAVLRRAAPGRRARRPADHDRRRPLPAAATASSRRCAASGSAPSAATR